MPYAILLSPFVPGGYSLPEDLEMFFVGHNSEWIFQCHVTALSSFASWFCLLPSGLLGNHWHESGVTQRIFPG